MSDLLLHPEHAREPMQASFSDEANPLGLDGIEFIEYATIEAAGAGQVLEMMGFRPVARHRSREVLLYRQGDMNIVVNAHRPRGARAPPADERRSSARSRCACATPRAAYRHVLERGAWDVPTHPEAMELNIPAIHGVGGSRIYFVDRYREFSIYDVDFVPIPTRRPAPAGARGHALVRHRAVHRRRPQRRLDRVLPELFGFRAILPDEQRFGILPKGTLLDEPVTASSSLQLIEPEPGMRSSRAVRMLQRVGLGAPDVLAAVRALRERGMEFVEIAAACTPSARGALTKTYLGGVVFELVHSDNAVTQRSRDGMPAAMTPSSGFGMDTITLAGPLEAKLEAMRDAGFIAGDAQRRATSSATRRAGQAAVRAVRASGLRVTGFQVLRDFEGLSGHLHDYKVDIAKAMLEMCARAGLRRAAGLLVDVRRTRAATSTRIARDLRKLAMLAVPFGISVAYEGCPGAAPSTSSPRPGTSSCRADRPTSARPRLVPHPGGQDVARAIARARPAQDLPGAAVGLHVAGDPHVRGAHRHRAHTSACSPARACTATQLARDGASAGRDWAIAATTASRSSTTTTRRCRCRWWRERARRSALWLAEDVLRRVGAAAQSASAAACVIPGLSIVMPDSIRHP